MRLLLPRRNTSKRARDSSHGQFAAATSPPTITVRMSRFTLTSTTTIKGERAEACNGCAPHLVDVVAVFHRPRDSRGRSEQPTPGGSLMTSSSVWTCHGLHMGPHISLS